MMKKITKFVTLLLALAMVFSLAACSSGKDKDKADGSADIATLIATEPNSADEAAKLYQQLMQKENDILAANSELWNKVFLSANKNSTMIEDGTNYGDFLLATIESAKDGFSADELKTLKAGAEQIKEIEGKLTILEQKYPGCGTAPGAVGGKIKFFHKFRPFANQSKLLYMLSAMMVSKQRRYFYAEPSYHFIIPRNRGRMPGQPHLPPQTRRKFPAACRHRRSDRNSRHRRRRSGLLRAGVHHAVTPYSASNAASNSSIVCRLRMQRTSPPCSSRNSAQPGLPP